VDIERWRAQYAILDATGAWQIVALFGGGGIFGGIVSLIYLFRQRSGWRVLLIAPLIGVLAGEAGVLILLAPGAMWRTIFSVTVLVAAAVMLRLDAD